MVNHRSSREEVPCRKHTLTWTRKPSTPEERIEEWLGSSDLHDLLTAMDALEKQGSSEADSLLRSLVQHDAQKYRTGQKRMGLGAILLVLVSIAILFWNVIYPNGAANAALFLLILVWLFAPAGLSWYGDYRTYGRRLAHATALLNRSSLPTVAAETLGTWAAADSRIPSLAAQSPAQRLPESSAGKRVRLSTRHRIALRRALRRGNSELILAILQMSDRILDTTFIPEVRQLTKCPDWMEDSAKIQATARRSLAALKADAESRRTLQALPEESWLPSNPVEELLSQTTGDSIGPAQRMLRGGEATCPVITAENRYGVSSGLCALSSPPCPADAAQFPLYP